MTRDLHAEIQTFLAANGPATASEIALGIRCRHRDIVETLAAFPRVPSPVGASPRAAHYAAATSLSQAVPSRQSGTVSQTARIARYLSDGREHSMEDVHRAVGFCRLNSRISELRSRGYGIQCRREGRSYFYTLTHDPTSVPLGESESLPQPPSGVSDSPSVTLSLFEVA